MVEKNEESNWFTVEEAQEYLKVSKTTLYSCMKDRRLPFYYIKGTRQRRLLRDDLDALLIPGTPDDLDTEEIIESNTP